MFLKLKKIVIFILYISIIGVADLLSTKTLSLPLGVITTWGTVSFSLVFTIRDILHEQGLKLVYLGIIISSFFGIFLSLFLSVPFQIIFASTITLILSELTDTYIFEKLKSHRWFKRSIFSNLISIPVDSILFNIIAFSGIFNSILIIQLILSQILIKYIIASFTSLLINYTYKNVR
jgi:queuosine precursor transporter